MPPHPSPHTKKQTLMKKNISGPFIQIHEPLEQFYYFMGMTITFLLQYTFAKQEENFPICSVRASII